jgi:hypothetical protein
MSVVFTAEIGNPFFRFENGGRKGRVYAPLVICFNYYKKV